MSARIEAATYAFHKALVDPCTLPEDWTGEIRSALAASDAVLLSDATVERIADVVFPKATTPILVGFKQTRDEAWVLARDEHHTIIRSVLAAAVEADR